MSVLSPSDETGLEAGFHAARIRVWGWHFVLPRTRKPIIPVLGLQAWGLTQHAFSRELKQIQARRGKQGAVCRGNQGPADNLKRGFGRNGPGAGTKGRRDLSLGFLPRAAERRISMPLMRVASASLPA